MKYLRKTAAQPNANVLEKLSLHFCEKHSLHSEVLVELQVKEFCGLTKEIPLLARMREE